MTATPENENVFNLHCVIYILVFKVNKKLSPQRYLLVMAVVNLSVEECNLPFLLFAT